MGPWLALYFAFRVLFGMKNLHKAAIMDCGFNGIGFRCFIKWVQKELRQLS